MVTKDIYNKALGYTGDDVRHTDKWTGLYNAYCDKHGNVTPEEFTEIYSMLYNGSNGKVVNSYRPIDDEDARAIDKFIGFMSSTPVSMTDALCAINAVDTSWYPYNSFDKTTRNRLAKYINALIDKGAIPIERISIKTRSRVAIYLYKAE